MFIQEMAVEVQRAYPDEEADGELVRMDAYIYRDIGIPHGTPIHIKSDIESIAVTGYLTDPHEHGKGTIRIPKPMRMELNVEPGESVQVAQDVRQLTPSL